MKLLHFEWMPMFQPHPPLYLPLERGEGLEPPPLQEEEQGWDAVREFIAVNFISFPLSVVIAAFGGLQPRPAPCGCKGVYFIPLPFKGRARVGMG
ncbi:MAG: hypothetical protein FD134_825 [Gallionellaceae bacterium]|nr:MAG: hypothetical protein FD134_825 [Gallionellaceae bacterium]